MRQIKPILKLLSLLKLGRGFWLRFAGSLLLLALFAGLEGVVHPLLIRAIFDEGVLRGNFSRFELLVLLYVSFGLLINALNVAGDIWNTSLENMIVSQASNSLLRAYYQAEYADVLTNGSGSYVNRVIGDVQEGLVPLLRLMQSVTSQTTLFIASSTVLIVLSWRAFMVIAVLIPVAAVTATLLSNKIKQITSQEREQEGAVLSSLTSALASYRIVSCFNILERTLGGFDFHFKRYLSTCLTSYKLTRSFQGLTDSMMVIADFSSMFVGALLVLRHSLTFGSYLAFVNTFWRAVTTLMGILGRATEFQRISVIANRMLEFASATQQTRESNGPQVRVTRIGFRYGDVPVIEDFSLEILDGERVLICGDNGSGKTTVANILAGFLKPTSGAIVLPQQISAITLPIYFPRLRVNQLVTQNRLLRKLGLSDELDDKLAENLSAGQQQRVAIAIALSKQADVYILDEPLANIDDVSKRHVLETVFEETCGKSLIIIMHGGSSYRSSFDRVIDMAQRAEHVLAS